MQHRSRFKIVIILRWFQDDDVVCRSQTRPNLFFSHPSSVNNSTFNTNLCKPFSTTNISCRNDSDNFISSREQSGVSRKQLYILSESSVCSIANTTILVLAKTNTDLSKLFSTKPSWMLFEGANSQCYKHLGSKWIFLPVHCFMDQVTIYTNRYLLVLTGTI